MQLDITDKIRILVIDDHKIVINGIQLALQDAFEMVVEDYATNAADAQRLLQKRTFDVILLDIQLPDMDGLELCKVIKKEYPQIRIIGLTTFNEVSFISEMMKNGADGYLFKDTSEEELVHATRQVFSGSQYLSEEVNKRLLAKALKRPSPNKNFIPKITLREKEVLQLIASEYTTKEIAKELFLSVSTVEKHRMNLFVKLDVRNAVGLLKQAIKFGLLDS